MEYDQFEDIMDQLPYLASNRARFFIIAALSLTWPELLFQMRFQLTVSKSLFCCYYLDFILSFWPDSRTVQHRKSASANSTIGNSVECKKFNIYELETVVHTKRTGEEMK